MCADIALHDKNDEKVKLKNGNYKTRKINTTDWNEQDKAEQWRKAWVDITNKYLKENSIQEKVDHRSYKRQGIEQIPTIHLGVSASQTEKKGIATDRGNINREIKHQNKILREIARRIKALLNWIRGIGKEERAETENIKSTFPPKENLISVFENLIRNNTENHNAYLEKYIKSYQLLKEKNITSLSELKESIVALRDKNYKTTRALKDTEKKTNDKVELIDQAEKYLKHKDIYKAYTKTKKSKKEDFYNGHTAEIILFESAKKYLKEHLGESKTLNISKWKSELTTLKQEKKSLYNQILKIREEVKQDEKAKVKPMEKSIEDLEAKKMQNFEKYKLGKMNRQKFIDSKNSIDEEIQTIKEKKLKAKEEKEVIDNTKLTRELMEKYIDSVFCEGNEVLNMIWK